MTTFPPHPTILSVPRTLRDGRRHLPYSWSRIPISPRHASQVRTGIARPCDRGRRFVQTLPSRKPRSSLASKRARTLRADAKSTHGRRSPHDAEEIRCPVGHVDLRNHNESDNPIYERSTARSSRISFPYAERVASKLSERSDRGGQSPMPSFVREMTH